jgi:dGTPase
VYDVINATQSALHSAQVSSIQQVRASTPLVLFSKEMREQSRVLKVFLKQKLYRHAQVMHSMDMAKQVIRDLFAVYCQSPDEMHLTVPGGDFSQRKVADYIAGMTDRYAMREHRRLFSVDEH